jgi:hypothetical protein
VNVHVSNQEDLAAVTFAPINQVIPSVQTTGGASEGGVTATGRDSMAIVSCQEARLLPLQDDNVMKTDCKLSGGDRGALIVQALMKDGRVLTAPVQRLVVS